MSSFIGLVASHGKPPRAGGLIKNSTDWLGDIASQ